MRSTNIVDGTADAGDCDGHGTVVGGIALGRNVGVAKEASLVAVRVLDCQVSASDMPSMRFGMLLLLSRKASAKLWSSM